MVRMDSALPNSGAALNPRLVEQQLVGGAWMGSVSALDETNRALLSPIRGTAAARLCRISDARFPATSARTTIAVLDAPGGGWSVRWQGPGRDVRAIL